MKRTLGLIFIYILEVLFGVFYYVKSIWKSIINALPFFNTIASWIRFLFKIFKGWLNFEFFNGLPNIVKNVIIALLLNLIFTILYLIIFGIIAKVQKNIKKKRIASESNRIFTLSEEEKAKFEWKLFERKFPGRRIASLIIPLSFVFACIVIRFDISICNKYDAHNKGFVSWFSQIQPYLTSFGLWIEDVTCRYIVLNNRIVNSIGVVWFEWVEIAIGTIVLVFIWYGIFSIFAKPFGRHKAKQRAKKAREKYIYKMELLEYKAWKKAQNENKVSQKNKELFENEESLIVDSKSNIKPIAEINVNNKLITNNVSIFQKDYIDDISTGVTDLGLIEEDNSELKEPLIKKETHFVGDEDVDIVLEEEPIVETIEEEEEYYSDTTEEQDETFDRFQIESISSLNLDDKIKKYNIDVIEEGGATEHYLEEEVPVIQEYEDMVILSENIIDVNQNNNNIKESNKKEVEVKIDVKEDNVDSSDDASIKKIDIKKINQSLIKRPTKPIEISVDRQKINEYIVETSKNQALIFASQEVYQKNDTPRINIDNTNGIKILHQKNVIKKSIKPVDPIQTKRK